MQMKSKLIDYMTFPERDIKIGGNEIAYVFSWLALPLTFGDNPILSVPM
jgi:hypothetical protein